MTSSICNLNDWNLLTNQFIFQNNFWFVGFHSKRPYATRNFLSPHFTSTHSHWLESKSKSLLQKKLFDIKRSEPTEDAFHHTNTNISINCVLYILWPRLWLLSCCINANDFNYPSLGRQARQLSCLLELQISTRLCSTHLIRFLTFIDCFILLCHSNKKFITCKKVATKSSAVAVDDWS